MVGLVGSTRSSSRYTRGSLLLCSSETNGWLSSLVLWLTFIFSVIRCSLSSLDVSFSFWSLNAKDLLTSLGICLSPSFLGAIDSSFSLRVSLLFLSSVVAKGSLFSFEASTLFSFSDTRDSLSLLKVLSSSCSSNTKCLSFWLEILLSLSSSDIRSLFFLLETFFATFVFGY